MGDQQTTMANVYVLARPTDDLTIKLFGFMSEDNDGPAASAFISAYDINDFTGNVVVQGQSNCLINGKPYFCSVPDKADPISYNTSASEASKFNTLTTLLYVVPDSVTPGGEFSDALYYFMRADYVFKSGQWVNQANFLKTGAIQKVNLRAGITVDNIDIQVFVNNAFEDTDYTTGYD